MSGPGDSLGADGLRVGRLAGATMPACSPPLAACIREAHTINNVQRMPDTSSDRELDGSKHHDQSSWPRHLVCPHNGYGLAQQILACNKY